MKTALITGATSEIGIEICKALAKQNINIIIHYNSNYDKALKLEEELKKYSIDTLTIKADLKKEEEINNLIDKSLKKFNKIDILVNNAALDKPDLFQNKNKEDFMDILSINLVAPFLLSKKIGDLMYENKYGKIINIASTNGIDKYFPMSVDYDASKAGLINLTHNLSLQFKPYVNVNSVSLGWILLEKDKCLDSDYLEEEKRKIFKDRFGRPSDVSSLVEFLVSDEAEFINNQNIILDGGMY